MKGIETCHAKDRRTAARGSDHCPAMKGIETQTGISNTLTKTKRSDHCPAMKGIETMADGASSGAPSPRSDHCPAMKGIKTSDRSSAHPVGQWKRPLPCKAGNYPFYRRAGQERAFREAPAFLHSFQASGRPTSSFSPCGRRGAGGMRGASARECRTSLISPENSTRERLGEEGRKRAGIQQTAHLSQELDL